MDGNLMEPKETDNIDCHLQTIGMGGLICRAVRQTGEKTTNEVTPSICFNCEAGQIYREVGCDAATPKLHVYALQGKPYGLRIDNLFCNKRKRNTSLNFCKSCGLAIAETTRSIITTARGLFEAQGFYAAYKDIEKARESIRDGNFDTAITRSISCLESTMRISHDKLGEPLPQRKQVTDLWKSTRRMLFDNILPESDVVLRLLNALSGVVSNLGAMGNILGDRHGKGDITPSTSECIAEVSLNTAATISTMIIRKYIEKTNANSDG